jgi:hypothetical protein
MYLLIVGVITFGCMAKTIFFPDYFEKNWKVNQKSNDFVIGFMTLTGSFLSITMGLIAVGTFENFNEAEQIVSSESNALTVLYQSVDMLEGPSKNEMRATLKNYTKYVINDEWPNQQQGIVLAKGNFILDEFRFTMKVYGTQSQKDFLFYDKLQTSYNTFLEKRRKRLDIVNNGLPTSIYTVLIIGLFLNVIISWLIKVDNRKLELIVSFLMGIIAGSLVFIIVAMDNPFRGQFSVSADSFKMVLETVMAK